jgi:hypothetical protein
LEGLGRGLALGLVNNAVGYDLLGLLLVDAWLLLLLVDAWLLLLLVDAWLLLLLVEAWLLLLLVDAWLLLVGDLLGLLHERVSHFLRCCKEVVFSTLAKCLTKGFRAAQCAQKW